MTVATTMPDAAGLTVRPLSPALGAEVTGPDLRQPPDPATLRALRAAWIEHLVLVLPGQAITDDQQIAFARGFGDLEVHHQRIIRSARAPEIFRVANVDEDGSLMPADHPSVAQVNLARRWHTDSSFRRVPCMGSILRGVEVTDSGGETCFTNMYAAYEALPGRLKQAVAGRRALHDFEHLHTLAPLKPLTDYSKYKAMCEEVLEAARAPGFTCLTLRPATVSWTPASSRSPPSRLPRAGVNSTRRVTRRIRNLPRSPSWSQASRIAPSRRSGPRPRSWSSARRRSPAIVRSRAA